MHCIWTKTDPKRRCASFNFSAVSNFLTREWKCTHRLVALLWWHMRLIWKADNVTAEGTYSIAPPGTMWCRAWYCSCTFTSLAVRHAGTFRPWITLYQSFCIIGSSWTVHPWDYHQTHGLTLTLYFLKGQQCISPTLLGWNFILWRLHFPEPEGGQDPIFPYKVSVSKKWGWGRAFRIWFSCSAVSCVHVS